MVDAKADVDHVVIAKVCDPALRDMDVGDQIPVIQDQTPVRVVLLLRVSLDANGQPVAIGFEIHTYPLNKSTRKKIRVQTLLR